MENNSIIEINNDDNNNKSFDSNLMKQFLILWEQITLKNSINQSISNLLSNYLFNQSISCHNVLITISKIIKKTSHTRYIYKISHHLLSSGPNCVCFFQILS